MESSPPPVMSPTRTAGAGLAMASLILGIVGLVTSIVVVGAFLGVVGLALGAIHLAARKDARRMARWGVGLSAASVLVSVGVAFLFMMGMRQATRMMPGGPGQGGGVAAWVGRPAPDFEIVATDGTRWKLSELRGRRVVLDFWATWCPPCVKEIPHFVDLRRSLGTNEVVLLAISNEDRAVLKPFIAANAMNYPVASAAGVDLPEPFASVNALPTTVFIDRQGLIQEVLVGYHGAAELKRHATAADMPAGTDVPH